MVILPLALGLSSLKSKSSLIKRNSNLASCLRFKVFMKTLAVGLSLLLFTINLPAGRAPVDRAAVRNVSCVVLESLPLQYSGTAEVTLLKNNRKVTMQFVTSEDVDVYEVCTKLQDAEGTSVSLIYNLDGEEYQLKGFVRRGHSHIVDGSEFDDN